MNVKNITDVDVEVEVEVEVEIVHKLKSGAASGLRIGVRSFAPLMVCHRYPRGRVDLDRDTERFDAFVVPSVARK